eukprot:11017105-Ditylum_brightwellii.AAC.1
MKKLTNKVQERKIHLKAKIALREELAAAFLFAVTNSVLNFNNIISKISLGEYNINLPKMFVSATKKTHCEDSNQDDSSKKKKAKKDQKKERAITEAQYRDFAVKEGESWKLIFCGKCVGDQPRWKDGTKIKTYPWFHITKYCFKDCMHAALHVRQDKILQEKVVELKNYMQTVQEED